ncbi:MAG: vanadium-dependent haloperoxidase [Saprospiraceae bacterium]|nr:vanadium-dependent haloperoxidase [Saprospiraceae bacterium]
MKTKSIHIGSWLVFCVLAISCSRSHAPKYAPEEIVRRWAEMTLFITKNTPANSPTFASRAMGYIGLTMYESVVPGFSDYRSVADQLNGTLVLPGTTDQHYDWVLALNAGQAQILRSIYIQTSDSNKLRIDSLEKAVLKMYSSMLDRKTIQRSVDFGSAVADSIFHWSMSDGGHRGYLHNFDKTMVHPEFPGSWKPPLYSQSISHFPLHPYWGKNRTFVKANADLKTPDMIPYSEDKNSAYYHQYLEVYQKEKTLTQAEKEAAIWWGDDPDVTFTPPGHSFYLAMKVMDQTHPDFILATMTYARVGLAVADAFINCWKWKYHFFSERPNTYIPAHIDKDWVSFWPDPPFPAFPSGHAINAGAATTILQELYGEQITVVDSSHAGRHRDEVRNVDFVPQSFTSLSQLARAVADSRFYGGIHTHQDNDIGLQEGARIAQNIIALKWKKAQ